MSRWRLGWRGGGYLFLVVVAAILVFHWRSVLLPIWRQHGTTLAGCVAFMILALIVQARNFVSFLNDSRKVRISTLSRVWALTALLNYLGPLQPGVAARVAYLSKRGVKIGDSVCATWRQICVSVWISLGGAAIGLWLTGDSRGRYPAMVLCVAFFGVVLLRNSLLSILNGMERPAWFVRYKKIIHDAIGGITFSGVIGVVAQYAIGTLLLLWTYHRFGADITTGQAIVLSCMVYVSSLIAIMPGNFGIMDGIYMIGGHGVGLSVAESAALALLLRAAHIIGCGLVVLAGDFLQHATKIRSSDG